MSSVMVTSIPLSIVFRSPTEDFNTVLFLTLAENFFGLLFVALAISFCSVFLFLSGYSTDIISIFFYI